jgi:superfamily I DNA and/or RNA helicase
MSLFKANPNAKFIVAGDPKQIPPVIEIDEKELENFDFQDENIYKMMNLESFKPEEQKIRPNDTIQNLESKGTFVKRIHLQCCNKQSKRLFGYFASLYSYSKQ